MPCDYQIVLILIFGKYEMVILVPCPVRLNILALCVYFILCIYSFLGIFLACVLNPYYTFIRYSRVQTKLS